MSAQTKSALAPALRKLKLWETLSDSEAQALLDLPHQVRTLRAHQFFVREQEQPRHCCVLIDGFATRHKTTAKGDRQIFSIHLPGDFIDLHNSLLRTADHSVEAITAATGAFIPVEAIKEMAFARPAIGRAMWYETLVDASIFREWTLNIGRRDALTRTSHMLCELAVRMEAAGLADHNGYQLPMTQMQLADALALTAVHVNRTIRTLREDGLVEFGKRTVKIIDFPRLALLGDFDPRYLHLRPGSI